MSKSSSAIGPLNESAVGIVYLRMLERDHLGLLSMVLPFRVLQLLHAVAIASVREELKV